MTSDTQQLKSLGGFKIGDLVKFHHLSKPVGIIIKFKILQEDPHPSQPERQVAYVEWSSKHTPRGYYQLPLLELAT